MSYTCLLSLRRVGVIRSAVYWALAGGGLLACSSNGDAAETAAAVSPPTGHYEGPITFQGSELRASLELRETQPGHLEAELRFPQLPGLEFEAGHTLYKAPQLRIEQQPGQPGGVVVQAVREGDFLRGVVSWDSIQADFVWARRGEAAPRGVREQVLPGPQKLRLLLPDDTLSQHPAVVLIAAPATHAAAAQRATYFARHGIAAVVVPLPNAPADSVAGINAAAVLRAVGHQTGIDSLKLGYWGRGAATVVLAAASGQQPAPAFAVLEGAPVASREMAQPYLVFAQRRIPVLGLYAGLDTTTQVPASSRRLRTVLGYRRNAQVRVFPQVTPNFIRPGRTNPDGQWQWPQPAPGYWETLLDWVKQR